MIAAGTIAYAKGAPPCSGGGRSLTTAEADAAITKTVASLVMDTAGKAEIKALLASVAEADFEQAGLEELLADPDSVENWRVGEAIGEAYLTEHRACMFPWPDGRDVRKEGSSLPGADLVGFQKDAVGDRFAFGEVKTSSENKYPPGLMYGTHGLKQQIEDLRDDVTIRNALVRYLGARATTASWKARFQEATKRYLQNKSDVSLFGVLVRDVPPHEDDVRVRVDSLAEDCPAGTVIELIGVYLPASTISSLGATTVAAKKGGKQ